MKVYEKIGIQRAISKLQNFLIILKSQLGIKIWREYEASSVVEITKVTISQ